MTDFILADRTELPNSIRTEFAALRIALRTAYEDALGRLDRLEALLTTREGYASLPKPEETAPGSSLDASEPPEKPKPLTLEERVEWCETIVPLLRKIITTPNTRGRLEFREITTVEVWKGKENARIYLHPGNEYFYVDKWKEIRPYKKEGTSKLFQNLLERLKREILEE